MNDELKEIISKADRVDGTAQKELMKRGDDATRAGAHEQTVSDEVLRMLSATESDLKNATRIMP